MEITEISEEKKMDKGMKSQITRGIVSLITRNIEAGSTYQQAKDQAYNRMEWEYPEVLSWYLLS